MLHILYTIFWFSLHFYKCWPENQKEQRQNLAISRYLYFHPMNLVLWNDHSLFLKCVVKCKICRVIDPTKLETSVLVNFDTGVRFSLSDQHLYWLYYSLFWWCWHNCFKLWLSSLRKRFFIIHINLLIYPSKFYYVQKVRSKYLVMVF